MARRQMTIRLVSPTFSRQATAFDPSGVPDVSGGEVQSQSK
jgi:hypothetical protein